MARRVPAVAIAATLVSACLPAVASEQIFTHTYLSEVNPKGAVEVEQWASLRTKLSQGTYRLWQSRTEIEYGITDRWQVSLYGNAYSVTAQDNNSAKSRNNFTAGPGDGDEVTGGGPATIGSFVPASSRLPIPAARYHESHFQSVSLESIYQLLSPYKDPIGLAGYVELTNGPRERELELKLLAQKNFLDDDLIVAGNLVVEFEKENYSRVGWEKETELTFTGGVSYRLWRGLRGALEMRNERVWEGGYGFDKDKRDHSAWFAGPTLHYAGKVGNTGFFATLGYSTQLPWASAYSASSKLEKVDGRVYKDAERNVWRAIVGVDF